MSTHTIPPGTVEIPLRYSDRCAIVDAADAPLVAGYNWRLNNKGYALAQYRANGRSVSVMMHRLVMDAPSHLQVDHVNHDQLDNRRVNLRLATASENNAARRTSGRYRGVAWNRGKGRWQAYVKVRGRQRHLGYFATAEEAAAAYDVAAVEEFGEFARTNLAAPPGPGFPWEGPTATPACRHLFCARGGTSRTFLVGLATLAAAAGCTVEGRSAAEADLPSIEVETSAPPASTSTSTASTDVPPATASIPPAPVETFVDPVPSPDQILALSWAPWLVEFQGLLEGIADQGEAGDVAALFAGCQDGLALLDRAPALWLDEVLAAETTAFLSAQRQSFEACLVLDVATLQVAQAAAGAHLEAMTDRIGELQ